MSRAYVFEVTDSDGYDSTQVIEGAPDVRTARRWAIAQHECAMEYFDAGPYVWATLEDTVTA